MQQAGAPSLRDESPRSQAVRGHMLLLGSGETTAHGRRALARLLIDLPPPVHLAILETPAGFQPNAALVARKLGDFVRQHLPELQPEIRYVAARQRGSLFDPDTTLIVEPLEWAHCVLAGPGSPTYMIRQLANSLTWQTLVRRWHSGLRLAFASAAAIAIGRFALPVYEIYKVGADLHWATGLDLFGSLGWNLVIVPHWNNREGGAELDTSRCFMGLERFSALLRLLPPEVIVFGLDEQTGCILNFATEQAQVIGAGTVTLWNRGVERIIENGRSFPLAWLASSTSLTSSR